MTRESLKKDKQEELKYVEFTDQDRVVRVPVKDFHTLNECYRNLKKFIDIQRSDASVYTTSEDKRFYERLDAKRKKRKCLSCEQEFLSTHSANRICPICKELRRADRSKRILLHSTWGDVKYD